MQRLDPTWIAQREKDRSGKNKGIRINGRIKQARVPGRFGQGSAGIPDRREQRKVDQSLGLVPFAVKLNSDLVTQLQALAQERQTGLSEVVAGLLQTALDAGVKEAP